MDRLYFFDREMVSVGSGEAAARTPRGPERELVESAEGWERRAPARLCGFGPAIDPAELELRGPSSRSRPRQSPQPVLIPWPRA